MQIANDPNIYASILQIANDPNIYASILQIIFAIWLQIANNNLTTKDMKQYEIVDLNSLIEDIKGTYRLSERDIMVRAGYNEEYLFQTRSRKKVSAKLMNALEREFKHAGRVAAAENRDLSTTMIYLKSLGLVQNDVFRKSMT